MKNNTTVTPSKIFIKRGCDVKVNGFTCTYTIRVWDMYDVKEVMKDGHVYYDIECETVDEFEISDKNIEEDYDGSISAMWKEIEEVYNLTERKYS